MASARDPGPSDAAAAARRAATPEEGLGPVRALEGVVEHGVEHGAVVLRCDDGSTWLVGAAGRPFVGHRVRVRGAERRGVLTTAQQGPPLLVHDIEDLEDLEDLEDVEDLEDPPAASSGGDRPGGSAR